METIPSCPILFIIIYKSMIGCDFSHPNGISSNTYVLYINYSLILFFFCFSMCQYRIDNLY